MLQAAYGPGSHTPIFSNTPLLARNNFWTNVQLSTKSDASSPTNILLSLIIFFNVLYSISKIALPRYSRLSYKKLNGWEFGHWLTANFTFPAVTWKNIVWPFSMPLWCNKDLSGQSASIIIAFEYLVCLLLRVPQAFFLGGWKVVLVFEIHQYIFFRPSSCYIWSNDFDNQQHFVLCDWWFATDGQVFLQTNFAILARQSWCAGA